MQVQIVIPENCLDDPRFGQALDYDQRIGRLISEDSALVSIDGETILFPKSWIKHYHNVSDH